MDAKDIESEKDVFDVFNIEDEETEDDEIYVKEFKPTFLPANFPNILTDTLSNSSLNSSLSNSSLFSSTTGMYKLCLRIGPELESSLKIPENPKLKIKKRTKQKIEEQIPENFNSSIRKCSIKDCAQPPNYGFPCEDEYRCKKHKIYGMISLYCRICERKGCEKHPSFNFRTEKRGRFCAEHKLHGMVNVVSQKCAHPDCYTVPFFNYSGKTKGLYCMTHKKEDMENIFKRCEYFKCYNRPNYGFPGSEKSRCKRHMLDGMVYMNYKIHSYRYKSEHGIKGAKRKRELSLEVDLEREVKKKRKISDINSDSELSLEEQIHEETE